MINYIYEELELDRSGAKSVVCKSKSDHVSIHQVIVGSNGPVKVEVIRDKQPITTFFCDKFNELTFNLPLTFSNQIEVKITNYADMSQSAYVTMAKRNRHIIGQETL